MFCNNCGNRIPDESTFCPFCMNSSKEDKKPKYNKVILILISIIAVLLIAFAVTYFLTKDNKKAEVSSDNADTTPKSSISEDSSASETSTSSTSTSTSTTTTTTAKPVLSKGLAYKAYRNTLDSLSVDLDSYYLYDIDADGLEELILKTGNCEGNYEFDFYTYTNTNEVKYLGSESGGHGGLAIPKSGGGIIVYQESQGYSNVTQINKQGDNYIVNRIVGGEYGSYFDIYCKDDVSESNALN